MRTPIKTPIQWTNNKSQPILTSDYRNIGITAVGTGEITAIATKDTNLPDFGSASTINNPYCEVVIYDETLTTGSFVNPLVLDNETKVAEIETNLLTWVVLERNVDTVDAFVTVVNNQ